MSSGSSGWRVRQITRRARQRLAAKARSLASEVRRPGQNHAKHHSRPPQPAFKFDSELARVDMRLSAFTDADARRAIFSYDLEILPILMKFDSHSEIDFPLDSVDREALGKWFDDRIVGFVRTYLCCTRINTI